MFLRRVIKSIGEPLPHENIDEMIAEADINKDGVINYVDFIQNMLNSSTFVTSHE
jgi:calmodulin